MEVVTEQNFSRYVQDDLTRGWQAVKIEQQSKLLGRIPKSTQQAYDEKVFKPACFDDVANVNVVIQQVITKDNKDQFDYLRHTISSVPQTSPVGRSMAFLVYERNSEKVLGLLELTTDLLRNPEKERFLGLTTGNAKYQRLRHHIRDHGVNLSICVPVQPFGYDFAAGKLLAMLSFSREVHQAYTTRYGHPIAYVLTTSINGKSVQYDRLTNLNFVGYTRGFGVAHLSERTLLEAERIIQRGAPDYDLQQASKETKIRYALKLSGLSDQMLCHGHKRGIYMGYTGTNAPQFLRKESVKFTQDLLECSTKIFTFWLNRWARQRDKTRCKEQPAVTSE